MSLAEILTAARALSREEQLQLAKSILAENESSEGAGLIAGHEYAIVTPSYGDFEAAAALQRFIDEERGRG